MRGEGLDGAGWAGNETFRRLVWLVRSVASAVVAAGLVANRQTGPLARPVSLAALGVCLLLMAVWAVVDLRGPGAERSRALALALGGMTVASGLVVGLPGVGGMGAFGTIATLEAGHQTRGRDSWLVLGAGCAAVWVGGGVSGASEAALLSYPLLFCAGQLAGLNRRAYRVRAEQAAAMLAQVQELRAEQRRVAVLDERARIAREIHDVLAHSLGALSIQVQAARVLLTDHGDHRDVERAAAMLTVAQRMTSEGLAETRRAVQALRSDPPPLEEQLTAMAQAHEQLHGTAVRLRLTGATAGPLSSEVSLAVLRIAQESLTNAAKHAPGRPVELDAAAGPEAVVLTVANSLSPQGGTEPDRAPFESAPFETVNGGYGLAGMRERLLLLDGTLTAGVRDGRWVVSARVPR